MITFNQRKLFNQKGLTLIEVLLSLVIISIILLAILFVLLQIIRTNKTSQELVNATYVAQTEMEEMYHVSQSEDFDAWIGDVQSSDKDYSYANSMHTIIYDVLNQYTVEMKISENEELPSPLKRITIHVFELDHSGSPKAKMENLLEWGPSP